MNFHKALSYLLSLGHETLTIKLGLANTETLLAALGNPHKQFPAVQIAGTNGKGSTAARLDSTTAAGAEIVAITSIAMDHEEYLGHTLAEIAAEKAAIIRPGVVAIIAPQVEEVRDVIVRQCEAAGVEPRFVEPSRHEHLSI